MTWKMTIAYSLNVLIHSAVYIYFVIYPFKRNFRFSGGLSKLLIALYVCLITAVDILFAESASPFPDYGIVSVCLWFALSTFFCLTLIKGNPVKLLFSFVIALALQFNQIVLARIIDAAKIFPVVNIQFPELNYLIYCIVTLAFVTPFLWYLFCYLLKRVEDTGINYTQWRFVFILPLSFYVYCIFSAAGIRPGEFNPGIITVASFLFINLFAYSSYVVILKMLLNVHRQLLAQQEVQIMTKQHALEKLHYNQIVRGDEQMKRMRHDWKQYLFTLKGYLDQGKSDELIRRLDEYLKQMDTEDRTIYCANETLNILLRYYFTAAKERGISVSTDIQPLENTRLSDAEMCIILGNLLQNALEACHDKDPQKFLRVSMMIFGTQIAVKIENSFYGIVHLQGEDYKSSKHGGEAIGIASVKSIVKQHEGILKITHENHIFSVNILLNI